MPRRRAAAPGGVVRALLVGLTATALLAAGCGGPDRGEDPPTGSPSLAAQPSGAASRGAAPGAPAGEVTLAFAGDVHFEGRARRLLDDPGTAFGPVTAVLSAADVAMLNLETAVTERGTPEPKTFRFRAPGTAFDAVVAAGIDVTTMGNNHGMDYGRVGLTDTLAAARERDHPVVGIGEDEAAAYAPHVVTVRGTRIAFLGLNHVSGMDERWKPGADRSGVASARDVERSVAAVRAARGVADVVVVFLHWNRESDSCPTEAAQSLARTLSEAGADALIGSHAHVLLGDGWLGRTYVAYGLGNFVWYHNRGTSRETGVLTVTVRGRQVVSAGLTPAVISETGRPVVATGAERERIAERYAGLRSCAGLADAPS